jgi:hypothetical protein
MKLTKRVLRKLIKEQVQKTLRQDGQELPEDPFSKLHEVLAEITNYFSTDWEEPIEEVAEKMDMTVEEFATLMTSDEKYDDEINYYVSLVVKVEEGGASNV